MTASKDFTALTKQLEEFNYTVVLIKRTLNNDCKSQPLMAQAEDDRQQILTRSFKRCNQLVPEVRDKFKVGTFTASETLRKEKLERDFRLLLTTYTGLIEKYERSKQRELDESRQSYRQSISHKRPPNGAGGKKSTTPLTNDSRNSSDDQQPNRIEMVEVNQDMLLQGQLIEAKAQQLLEIKNQMENVLSIQQQLAVMVQNQGKQLDVAEDHINDANKNVHQAADNLKDAKQHHKSASRKKLIIIGIAVVVVLIIVVPLIVKFI